MKTSTQLSVSDKKTLKTPLGVTGVLGVIFSALYYALGMRKAKGTNITTTKLGSAHYDIVHFGLVYFWGNVALDILLGFGTAVMMVWTVQTFMKFRSGSSAGAIGTAGTLGIAIAFFGCPTCVIPIAGSLGIGIFGTALPLFGTEFKFVALIFLGISLVMLNKQRQKQACSIPSK